MRPLLTVALWDMPKVEKPHNGGEWSKARLMGFIRSTLRRSSTRWNPRALALKEARRASQSDNKRLKWEFRCNSCGGWFARKDVEADHIVPAGSLRDFDDLPGFARRLFCEKDGFEILCKAECHHKKTHTK